MDFQELVQKAYAVTAPRTLSDYCEAGGVGCALLTEQGNVFTGVNVDACCGVGFCAEHAAIAAMLTAGENRILRIVAVGHRGNIMPPCGRCREFISQVHPDNLNTRVLIAPDTAVPLHELLPADWK